MRTKNGGGSRKSFYFPSSKGWLFTRGLVKKRLNFVWITGPKSIVRFTFKRISHWECSTGLSCCNWCIDLKFLPFLLQVRQINITSLGSFYESPMFTSNRFIHDKKRKLIIQTLWSFTSRERLYNLRSELFWYHTSHALLLGLTGFIWNSYIFSHSCCKSCQDLASSRFKLRRLPF